jgi:hypothetical protein
MKDSDWVSATIARFSAVALVSASRTFSHLRDNVASEPRQAAWLDAQLTRESNTTRPKGS